MKTINRILAIASAVLWTISVNAQDQIFVANSGAGTIGDYAISGAAINPSLISGLNGPAGVALLDDRLFVTNASSGTIGEYTTSGTTINASLISGLNGPAGIAVSGGNLFVANKGNGTIGEYTTSGAVVNSALVSGLNQPAAVAVVGSNLLVANLGDGTIGAYNATTGAPVNAALISGLSSPAGIAVSGGNLFVANNGNGTIGKYDASTGAPINSTFISGLPAPVGIAVSGGNLFVVNDGSSSSGTIGEYDATTGVLIDGALISGLNHASLIAIEAFGELDTTFHPPYFAYPDFGSRVVLLPNGKYVLNTNLETLADQPTGGITRYFANGTLDSSFQFSRDYQSVFASAPLPDSRLIVAAFQYTYGDESNDSNHEVMSILRLNLDGSIDPTFSSTARTTDGGEVRAISIQPDGKILVCGRFTAVNGTPRQGIARFNSDGTLDTTFATITLGGSIPFASPYFGVWGNPAIQTDVGGNITGILIGGDFGSVSDGTNSITCPGIARLHANGTVDTTFQPSGFSLSGGRPRPIRGVVIQSNGQIVIGGRFTVSASFASNPTGQIYNKLPLIRLNSDGSADQSYGYFGSMDTADSSFFQIRALVIQPNDKVLGVENSVFRFNTNGSLDSTFRQPDLLIDRLSANTLPTTFPSIPDAFTINLRSDGRVLIGGTFTDVDDAPPLAANGERWNVAQFNSDGTLDISLVTSHRMALDAYPTSFLRQSDGSTLIAFNQVGFSSGEPAIPQNYGRLFPDGSLDASFDPLASLPGGAATALGFTALPDGNIFGFGTNDQSGKFGYNVFTPDGTVVNPSYRSDPNVSFDKAYPQPLTNGQVLVLSSAPGAQSTVNNTELQRLNSDGSLDPSFVLDASVLANTVQRVGGTITTVASGDAVLAVLPNGKILFSYLGTDSTYHLVRLNPNGSLDSTFQAGSVPASTTSNSGPFIHDPQSNTDYVVTELLTSGGVPGFSDAQLVAGNQVVVVGQFTSYGGVPAHGIVRLNDNGTVDTTFQAGNGAQWTETTETAIFHPSIDNVELTGNGKLLITGTFEAFNGVPLPGIALLNLNGSLDTGFVPPATRQKFDYHTAYLAIQPDNSFLLSGPYSLPDQTQSPSFIHILGPPAITSPLTALATEGQVFIYQIVATSHATSFDASGLPAGLSVDIGSGLIYGIPSVSGTFSVSISASNSFGTDTKNLTLTVQPPPPGPRIISNTVATGRTGKPFDFQVVLSGATPSTQLTTTPLPLGLNFDSVSRMISGMPTSDGNFSITLTVTDGAATASGTLQLTFTSDPAVPVVTSSNSASLAQGQPFTYTVTADAAGSTFGYIGTDGQLHTGPSTAGLPSGLSFDGIRTISGTFSGGTSAERPVPNTIKIRPPCIAIIQFVATTPEGTGTQPLDFFGPSTVTASQPPDIVAEATGPGGAAVSFTPPTVTDRSGNNVAVTCDPPSGSIFPLGTKTVVCTSATDSAGTSAVVTFNVTVQDTTPPVITSIPTSITVPKQKLPRGRPQGATVDFASRLSATDLVDGPVIPTANPPSGSFFPLGTTTVTLTATDSHGNTATATFTVTVVKKIKKHKHH